MKYLGKSDNFYTEVMMHRNTYVVVENKQDTKEDKCKAQYVNFKV